MKINGLGGFFALNKYRHLFALLLIIIVLSENHGAAQNFYRIKKVDLPTPFKYSDIRSLTQDKDGYIWFTTSQGIWRYDGTDVQPFDPHDPQLDKTDVPDIYAYDGYILMFFNKARECQLVAYDTYTSKVTKYQLDETPVNFYADKKGALSFYSLYGQKWSFSRKTLLVKGPSLQQIKGWKPKQVLDNIKVDADGSAYLFYGEKIARLKNGQLYAGPDSAIEVHGDKSKNYQLTQARDILISPTLILAKYSNAFIIFDKRTLKKVYEYKIKEISLALTLNDQFILFKNGNAPMETNDRLFKIQQSPFSGLAGNVRSSIAEAGTANMLVATDNGIFEVIPDSASNANSDEKKMPGDFFKNKSIRSICRAQNGEIYIGAYGGFFRVDHAAVHLLNTTVIYCMKQADAHTLILGTEGGTGFATLDTQTDSLHLIPSGGKTIYGYCLAKDNDGYIGGAAYALFTVKNQGGQWQSKLLLHSDSLGFTKQITKINQEWYVASTTGLFRLNNNNTLTRIFPLNEKYAIYAMLPEGKNIWLGTGANGLIKIDLNGKILQQLTFSNGLAGEFVYSLFKTNGLLFAGTDAGLSVFDTNAGMQPIPSPDDEEYNQELNHSAIFYDEYQRQLLMGGIKGLLIPDMGHYALAKSKIADVVKLSYFKKGSNGILPAETNLFAYLQKVIILNPGDAFMGLKFSSNNIWQQGKFLFRIRELDTTWRAAKLSDEISFYALAPGAYTLQARFPAVSDPHSWLNKIIIVAPHFYQTWMFKLLVVLIAASVVYAAWLYRLRKIRGEQLMRTAIASDLHDEIGSTLTRISINSELLTMSESSDKEALETISNDSKKAISSISDIIWSVDARNDNKEDLVLRMKDHAHKMLEDIAEIHYSVNGLSSTVNIPQSLRQNIYLIFKEAINNIIRHNISPEVWISIENGPAGFTMEVKNTIQHKKGTGYKGQGLKNMEMRAKRINALINVAEQDGIFSVTLRMKEWK